MSSDTKLNSGKNLLWLLNEFKDLFDDTLDKWDTDSIDLELKQDSNK